MALIWAGGAETNSTTAGVEFSSSNISGGGALSVSTSNPRSGTYSWRANNSGASGLSRYNLIYGSTPNAIFYQICVYIVALPTAGTPRLLMVWDGTNIRSAIQLNTDGTLTLHSPGATQIGSASAALSLNTYYTIELKHQSGTGIVEAKLNGSTFASTSSGDSAVHDRVSWGMCSNTTGHDIYMDDIIINNDASGVFNSWNNGSKLAILRPNAAGDNAAWGLGAGSGANYQLVNEVTPDDNTSYIRSRVTNQVDDYNIENFPGNSYDTIRAVAVWYRATRSTGTTSSSVAPRIKAAPSGTVLQGTTKVASNSSYRTNDLDTNDPPPLQAISYVLPGTATAWTPSDVDTAQIGFITVSGSGDRYVHITTAHAIVIYDIGTPPPAGNAGILMMF